MVIESGLCKSEPQSHELVFGLVILVNVMGTSFPLGG